MSIFGRRKINERFSDTPASVEENEKKRGRGIGLKKSGSSEEQLNLEAAIDLVSYAPEKYTSVPSEADKTTTVTCNGCNSEIPIITMRRNLYVCPNCGKHLKISARRRMRNMVDPGTFRKLKLDIPSLNPLDYPEYDDKIAQLKDKTGLDEGVLSGVGEIEGEKAVIAVMGSEFLMGSMGIAVGEMITNSFEVADKLKLPLIIFTASGGARMQEGILSLMQMAKTSAAAKRFSDHGGLYISCLTHPTTGGVSASFATLADITLAEPDALIGFAGPRVIEQTIGQKLPEGFQRAEYLETHGFVDQIVNRKDMREVIAHILRLHSKKRRGK
ncbi:acetyl-CoA carboxylase carboxyl transferase subunit beta [Eubacterium ruminantium]|nr:acetyl-CoA carboxylase carboxyl transferase subunit beta [Eubacterium ruminantium]